MDALWSVVAVISLAVVVLAALGVVSCLVSPQRPVPRGMGGEPPHSTLPMLALHSGMERLRLEAGVGAGRPERQSAHAAHAAHARRAVDCAVDRAVRLAAVSTDLQLDLPPSIALPDGEEFPYGASARLHIRDPEQESEIYQKCIRPPPNRTVFDGESPPPYRSGHGHGPGHSHGAAILSRCPGYPMGHPMVHPQPQAAAPSPLHPAALQTMSQVGPLAAGHIPAVIVPSPSRTAPSPGPGATGKHSTTLPTPSSAAAAAAAASGLVRLLTPSPAAERADRAVTVPVSSSSRTAQSVEVVNVSDACCPAVRDIPGAGRATRAARGHCAPGTCGPGPGPGPGSHLATLTMVPCLTETRTEPLSGPLGSPEGPGRTTARSAASGAVPAAPVGPVLPRPPV